MQIIGLAQLPSPDGSEKPARCKRSFCWRTEATNGSCRTTYKNTLATEDLQRTAGIAAKKILNQLQIICQSGNSLNVLLFTFGINEKYSFFVYNYIIVQTIDYYNFIGIRAHNIVRGIF